MKTLKNYFNRFENQSSTAFFVGLFVLIFLFPLLGKSQNQIKEWSLSSVTIQTGETPLTKGITITPSFSVGESTLLIDFNAELGEVMYFQNLTGWVSGGPSGGFYKNSPWVGPIWSFNLFDGHLTTLNWFGWSFGNPEEGTTKENPKFLFSYHQANIIFNPFEVYYVFQHYQELPVEHITGMKFNFNPNKKIVLSGGLGYMFHAEKPLWSMGMSYRINNK
ncbi:MAG: hypothetical protein KC516_02095 [Nanoarchaeota archaeon]|nr:hypothetical protein [Nanoarchaeota archaeon]